MPLLASLSFFPTSVSYENMSNSNHLIVLPHLKRIKIDEINCAVLKFKVAKQLKEIAISGYRVSDDNDFQSLVEFMKNAENMEKLSINENSFLTMFERENIVKYNFKLKSFEVAYQNYLTNWPMKLMKISARSWFHKLHH